MTSNDKKQLDSFPIFEDKFRQQYGNLLKDYPVAGFILDHYLRLYLVKDFQHINHHVQYIKKVLMYGKLFDSIVPLLSRVLCKKKRFTNNILLFHILYLFCPDIISDFSRKLKYFQNKSCQVYFTGYLTAIWPYLSAGIPYYSFNKSLFGSKWSLDLKISLEALLSHDFAQFISSLSALEESAIQAIDLMAHEFRKANIRHVVGIRDFFWYEAATILACRKAGAHYHMLLHGFPHVNPKHNPGIGILPFRGDFIYVYHDLSYQALAEYIPAGCLRRISFPVHAISTSKEKRQYILFISSVHGENTVEERKKRLALYESLSRLADKIGFRVKIRFREDENLKIKIQDAKKFGFHFTVKDKLPLKKDLNSAFMVIGYPSTALFIAQSANMPTFQIRLHSVEPVPDVDIISFDKLEDEIVKAWRSDSRDCQSKTNEKQSLSFIDYLLADLDITDCAL